MGKMSFLNLILYTIIPFGQLWTRVFDYDGSIDMWWFFIPIFMIPPLQFIPVLMLYLDIIKPGKGGKVYDNYVWIPIVTKFCVQFFGEMLLPPDMAYIAGELIIIVSIMITKYFHSVYSCNVAKKELSVTWSKFGDFFIDAIFENGTAGIFNVVIGFIPIIGWAIMAISMIGPLNNIMVFLMYMAGYIFIYTIQNMFEQADMNSLCNLSSIPGSSYVKLLFGIIFSIVIFMNESFDPVAMVSDNLPFGGDD